MRPTFQQACRSYPLRYTLDHTPTNRWHTEPCDGKFYAPQYASDREWYANAVFPPESGSRDSCLSSAPTWPLGTWLDQPFSRTLVGSK